MTKKIISALLAVTMLFMTACGDSSTAEDSKTVESAAESASDSSERESDSKPSGDWNAELITTGTETKKTDSTTAKGSDSQAGATTTTKSASNDNDSKQKQPQEQQKPQSTQAQPRTTQGIPKATVKPVQTTKAVTKATVKTTQKQNSTVDISKLSKLQQAMYRLSKSNRNYNKQDLEIMRNELLAYGKSLYPSVPICTKLHPLITKDGRYTDSFDEAVGGTNSSTEWYMPSTFDSMNGTDAYIIEDNMAWEEVFKRKIKATLDNNARFGDIPTVWYITYGRENDGSLHWVCMTAFPEEWK